MPRVHGDAPAQSSKRHDAPLPRRSYHDYNTRSSLHADGHVSPSSESDDLEDEEWNDSPYTLLREDVARCRQEYLEESSSPSLGSRTPPPESVKLGDAQQGSQNWIIYTVLAVVVCSVALICILMMPEKVDEMGLRTSLTETIRNLHKKFPSQVKDIWGEFYSGIMKVLVEKPTEPIVFLLLHQDSATTSKLAQEVARSVHAFLEANEPSVLTIDGAALGQNATLLEDHGVLINDYRSLVERHRILVLENLQEVPATLAQALHVFCDTVTPLVDKAVYIFTLNVGSDARGKPMTVAERVLNSVWRQLDADIRSPLVARVTGGSVLMINP